MCFPRIDVRDRKVILLSGFRRNDGRLTITDEEKLEVTAQRYRNAVAFGYVAGKWVPAA